MAYGLIIDIEITKTLVLMDDETTHDLFVLAMLDLRTNPHGRGQVIGADGPHVRRAMALGVHGLIVYIVNDAESTVNVMDLIWTG
jgi:hypothetical protein